MSSSSMTEPGQPWVMTSGNAFSCGDFTWMKWMSTPSISVVNCGSAFSLASTRAEVVLVRPVVRERPDRRELDALRPISDELLGGPTCCSDAASKVGQLVVRDVDWNGRISVVVAKVVLIDNLPCSPNRTEGRAELFAEELRLLPGGEVAALVDFVEVDEVRIGLLGPAARRLVLLAREHGDGNRD